MATKTTAKATATALPLAEAIDDYLFDARRLSPNTYRWYQQKLAVFRAWCHRNDITTMAQVTARDVRRFLDSLDGVLNPRTGMPLTSGAKHGYTQVVKQWLRWCGREDYCATDLYDRIKLPRVEQKVITTLSKQHITALFAACAHESHPMLVGRIQALLAVMLSTGIRAAEACSLTLDSLHLDNPDDCYLRVRGKGNKWREVELADVAVKYLQRYIRLRTAQRGVNTLFVNQKGRALTPSGINQMLYRLADTAGIDEVKVSAHQTRRAFAVFYMEQDGADLFKLKELMGHSTIATTMIYLRDFKQKDARRGVNPLDRML
jgi:site-specific recombinase XerD